jgi:hydrogenase-4 component E
MNVWIETTFIFLVLTNLRLLGLSRLGACIRTVALQGVILGLLALPLNQEDFQSALIVSLGSIAVKGVVFPWLLFRAVREANVRREIEPYIGYIPSILSGVVLLGVSLWLGSRLPLPDQEVPPLVVPIALFTMLVGLFLIVSRKQALTQVLGYLVLENGIYALGVALVLKEPMLVELGVLLDVLVAVFVMGITIFQINRTFDDIDTGKLSALKD